MHRVRTPLTMLTDRATARRQASRFPALILQVWVERVARKEHVRVKSRHHHGRACRGKADVAGLIEALIVPVNERTRAAITFGSVFEEANLTPVRHGSRNDEPVGVG